MRSETRRSSNRRLKMKSEVSSSSEDDEEENDKVYDEEDGDTINFAFDYSDSSFPSSTLTSSPSNRPKKQQKEVTFVGITTTTFSPSVAPTTFYKNTNFPTFDEKGEGDDFSFPSNEVQLPVPVANASSNPLLPEVTEPADWYVTSGNPPAETNVATNYDNNDRAVTMIPTQEETRALTMTPTQEETRVATSIPMQEEFCYLDLLPFYVTVNGQLNNEYGLAMSLYLLREMKTFFQHIFEIFLDRDIITMDEIITTIVFRSGNVSFFSNCDSNNVTVEQMQQVQETILTDVSRLQSFVNSHPTLDNNTTITSIHMGETTTEPITNNLDATTTTTTTTNEGSGDTSKVYTAAFIERKRNAQKKIAFSIIPLIFCAITCYICNELRKKSRPK